MGEGELQENFEKEALFYEVTQKSQEVMKLYYRIPRFFVLVPVVQKLDSAIHWINYYSVDSAIHLLNNWGQY